MRRLGILMVIPLLLMFAASYADSGAFLGVYLGKVGHDLAKKMGGDGRGVFVEGVIDGTAAKKAGIKDHDVIVEIDGNRITGPGHLGELLDFYSPGDNVSVKVWRKGKVRTLAATLGTRKVTPQGKIAVVSGGPKAWLGVTVQSLTGQLGKYFGSDEGVLISSVVDDSPAEKTGLRAGDVITRVDDDDIDEPVDLPNAISAREPGTQVEIALVRGGKRLTKKVELAESPEEQRKKAQVYLWDSEHDNPTLELLEEKLSALEGLEGLEQLEGLEILGIPGVVLKSKLEEEKRAAEDLSKELAQLKAEREALRAEREALSAEREALRAQMEALRQEIEELKRKLD